MSLPLVIWNPEQRSCRKKRRPVLKGTFRANSIKRADKPRLGERASHDKADDGPPARKNTQKHAKTISAPGERRCAPSRKHGFLDCARTSESGLKTPGVQEVREPQSRSVE